jgi:two-component system response regulator YesN
MLENALRESLTELGGKTQCRCFLGIGLPVENPGGIHRSWLSSQHAICGRFLGDGRQIYYADSSWREGEPGGESVSISPQESRDFVCLVETINIFGFEKWTEDRFRKRKEVFENRPYMGLDFCLQVIDLMITVFRDLDVAIGDQSAFRKSAELAFGAAGSFRGLQRALVAIGKKEIVRRLSEKRHNMTMYAQQAMNFIDRHYAENITLEIIAEKLHISPVYLCVVFKNETGLNYSKYLTHVRVERAKLLLKKHEMNLSQISNAVGYDNATYFSNLFRKYTGIKPLEYRRLYQRNMGD